MANVIVKGAELIVKLSSLEKLAAFHGNVRVPLAAVESVRTEPHPWSMLRGIRAPGTGVPGLIAYGVRRFPSGKDFAALLGGRPAIRIELGSASPFSRLTITARDADAEVARIKNAATPELRQGH